MLCAGLSVPVSGWMRITFSTRRSGGWKFQVCLFCVNPSRNLQNFLEKGRSAVFFSATLLPIRYYKQLLSTEEEAYAIYARSPFDPATGSFCWERM